MEQRRNARVRETGDPRVNPPSGGIVRLNKEINSCRTQIITSESPLPPCFLSNFPGTSEQVKRVFGNGMNTRKPATRSTAERHSSGPHPRPDQRHTVDGCTDDGVLEVGRWWWTAKWGWPEGEGEKKGVAAPWMDVQGVLLLGECSFHNSCYIVPGSRGLSQRQSDNSCRQMQQGSEECDLRGQKYIYSPGKRPIRGLAAPISLYRSAVQGSSRQVHQLLPRARQLISTVYVIDYNQIRHDERANEMQAKVNEEIALPPIERQQRISIYCGTQRATICTAVDISMSASSHCSTTFSRQAMTDEKNSSMLEIRPVFLHRFSPLLAEKRGSYKGHTGTLYSRTIASTRSYRRRSAREATSGREICDCEYQGVKVVLAGWTIGLDAWAEDIINDGNRYTAHCRVWFGAGTNEVRVFAIPPRHMLQFGEVDFGRKPAASRRSSRLRGSIEHPWGAGARVSMPPEADGGRVVQCNSVSSSLGPAARARSVNYTDSHSGSVISITPGGDGGQTRTSPRLREAHHAPANRPPSSSIKMKRTKDTSGRHRGEDKFSDFFLALTVVAPPIWGAGGSGFESGRVVKWSSARMQGWGEREIPEKTPRTSGIVRHYSLHAKIREPNPGRPGRRWVV
ncbi:hypothetical protein PR048_031048 [Dryococelus australis]|uniref:Uncharacterized protein n=1 Tax=Dryococelus australis TaxID=614101 RepID=A0ABQ9G457_9NEOP|nr:hypothetical protein PR048_031048 [Dryococelus australis]